MNSEYLFALFVIFVFISLIFWSVRSLKFAVINFNNIARLLHVEVRRPFLNLPCYLVIEGMHQGRKVVFEFLGVLSSPRSYVWIQPHTVIDSNRSSGRVTPNTSLAMRGGRIDYYPGTGLSRATLFLRRMTDEEIFVILNELFEASKIVETDITKGRK